MEKYINKSYLLDALGVFSDYKNGNPYFFYGIQTAREVIADAPTADVAPVVHGQWKESKNFDDGFWVCSLCGFVSEATAAHKLYKYCPYCGAKMDLEG